MSQEPPFLNAMEARIFGCLIEKQLLTPDTYPLTLNTLQAGRQMSVDAPRVAAELNDPDAIRSLAAAIARGDHGAARDQAQELLERSA